MKCDTCLESRCVVSENGIHHVCCLPDDRDSVNCLIGKDDRYVANPMKVHSTDKD